MIAAIKNGDSFIFEQAYLETCEKVHAYFLKKTRSTEDARDLAQTVYLKLWQYRASLSDDFLLEQQLFHIARTVYIDYLRRENHRCRVEQLDTAMEENCIPGIYPALEIDLHTRLQHALSDMPETRKKVFELNRLHGYSYNEISQMLSISVKAVDNNLYKAVLQLRRTMLIIVVLISLLA